MAERKPLDIRFLMSLIIIIFTIGVTWGSMVWMVKASASNDQKQDERITQLNTKVDSDHECIIGIQNDVKYIKKDVGRLVQTQQTFTQEQQTQRFLIQEQKLVSKQILAQLKKMHGDEPN